MATTEPNDDAQPGALCANPACQRPLASSAFPATLVDGYCARCRVARDMDEWRARAELAILSLSPAGREAMAA